jgi:hypothetical protein
VAHADQRRLAPSLSGLPEQPGALTTTEPAEGLVKDRQSDVGAQDRAPESDPLPFPAGDETAGLSQRSLQTVLQTIHDLEKVGALDRPDEAFAP